MVLVLGFLGFLLLEPPLGAIALGAAVLVEVGESYLWWLYLKRFRVRTGVEAMVGRRAEVLAACDPTGYVRLAGERWRARVGEGEAAAPGEAVVVRGVEGLELEVEPTGEPFYGTRR